MLPKYAPPSERPPLRVRQVPAAFSERAGAPGELCLKLTELGYNLEHLTFKDFKIVS